MADPDKAALDSLSAGDFCTIFTPDDTHYDIAMYAIERGIHVLLTKPAVKTLKEHRALLHVCASSTTAYTYHLARMLTLWVVAHAQAARKSKTFVMIEYHKRFDPIYANARAEARSFGDFGYV